MNGGKKVETRMRVAEVPSLFPGICKGDVQESSFRIDQLQSVKRSEFETEVTALVSQTEGIPVEHHLGHVRQ